MSKSIKKSVNWTFAVISVLFTFIPESLFESVDLIPACVRSMNTWWMENATSVNVIICRLFLLAIIWGFAFITTGLVAHFKKKVTINGDNYTISIEYGDLLKQKKCQIVIPFDECFTSKVGTAPEDIKKTSICGQYLENHPDIEVSTLIKQSKLVPDVMKSNFQSKQRYLSGTIVPAGDDLLLAFAPLDKNGKGVFTSLDEYKKSLELMWAEIYRYSGQNDICIPILGSGITHFDGSSGAGISQQELLNIIIYSYKLNSKKIKNPNKLRIICRKAEGFSLNNIDCN